MNTMNNKKGQSNAEYKKSLADPKTGIYNYGKVNSTVSGDSRNNEGATTPVSMMMEKKLSNNDNTKGSMISEQRSSGKSETPTMGRSSGVRASNDETYYQGDSSAIDPTVRRFNKTDNPNQDSRQGIAEYFNSSKRMQPQVNAMNAKDKIFNKKPGYTEPRYTNNPYKSICKNDQVGDFSKPKFQLGSSYGLGKTITKSNEGKGKRITG